MILWGKEHSIREINAKTDNLYQLFGMRWYQLDEGATRGTKAIDVNTGSGLQYTIVPDRGMDISLAFYKGLSLASLTANGEIHPSFYESRGKEWARVFFGGLVTTCGLTYFGDPGIDGEEELGLHGRFNVIPARNVCNLSDWDGDEYDLILQGVIQETVQMGNKLEARRKILSRAGEPMIRIEDHVTNVGSQASPFTILYHINFGYPFLDKDTRLIIGSSLTEPFDNHSRQRISNRLKMEEPHKGFLEENYLCYCNPDVNGFGHALIVNDRLMGGLAVEISISADTLPYFCEWKMLDERDYTLGIEPCNVKCENRSVLREQNQLPFLHPGESRDMLVEIRVIEGKEHIDERERAIKLLNTEVE